MHNELWLKVRQNDTEKNVVTREWKYHELRQNIFWVVQINRVHTINTMLQYG